MPKENQVIFNPKWYALDDGEGYAYCYSKKGSCCAVKRVKGTQNDWVPDPERQIEEGELVELDRAGLREVQKMVLRGEGWDSVQRRNRGGRSSLPLITVVPPFSSTGGPLGERRGSVSIEKQGATRFRNLPAWNQPSAFTDYVTCGKYLKMFNPIPLVTDAETPYYSEKYRGSSLLLRLSTCTYMYVAGSAIRFTVPQPITVFHPIMGHSLVHYCWAESEDWIYLIPGELVAIEKRIWGEPNDIHAHPDDVYYFYYFRWGQYLPKRELPYKEYRNRDKLHWIHGSISRS